MPATKAPGRGNHRRGRSRGEGSRSGQLTWQKDLLIAQRVELVSRLYHHPRSVIHKAVNEWLVGHGEDPVDLRTIDRDRNRALEMWRVDGVVPNMDNQMAEVERTKADVWQSIEATPRGPARAGLYVVYLRAIEMQERMAGRWMRPIPEAQAAYGAVPEGPSPMDLFDRGEISEDTYLSFISVVAKTSGQLAGLPPGPVIEGQARVSEPDPDRELKHDSAVTPRPIQVRKGQVVVDEYDPMVDVLDPRDLE